MGWVEVLFLMLVVAFWVYIVLELWHVFRCPHCRAARTALKTQHPDWRVSTSLESHRAVEPDRLVVAVFYKGPGVISFPAAYKLFAVSNDLSTVEELPCGSASPYLIRGRK